jgi:hypothetical protein
MCITFLPAKAMKFKQKEMSSESADLYILIVVCRQNQFVIIMIPIYVYSDVSLSHWTVQKNMLTFGRICLHIQNGS